MKKVMLLLLLLGCRASPEPEPAAPPPAPKVTWTDCGHPADRWDPCPPPEHVEQ